MPFDGRNHGNPARVSPIRYYSESPATGFALSEVLTSSYVAARHNERLTAQTFYAHNFRDMSSLSSANLATPTKASPMLISQTFRKIPEEVTHVIFEAYFSAWISGPVYVRHSGTVTNGATTSTGFSDLEIDVAANNRSASGGGSLNQRLVSYLGAYGPQDWNRSSIVEVELDSALVGVECELSLDAGFSVSGVGGYRPAAVSVYWGCRG